MNRKPGEWIKNVAQDRMVLFGLMLGLALVVGVLIGAFAYRQWKVLGTDSATAGEAGYKTTEKSFLNNEYPAQFRTPTMYPAFDPKRRHYVTRCTPSKVEVKVNAFAPAKVKVAGYPPATGRFITEARPLPGQDFDIEIEGAGDPVDGTYTLRCLPVGFPEWNYRQYRKPPKGEFVVAFRPAPMETERPWVVVFDQDGTPRWWYSPDFNALWAQVLDDGTVQWARGFGDGFGQDSRGGVEVRKLDGTQVRLLRTVGAPIDGHEFLKLDNGNYLLMSYKPRLGVDLSELGIKGPSGVFTGEIQEVTPDGKVVWQWNSWDQVGIDQMPEAWKERVPTNPRADLQGRDRYDYFHLNSIEPWGDQIVISSRHTDAVYGISRKTGEILWKLGGTPTSKSLQVVGPDPYADYPLSGNHDARITDGNLLSVHDNGTKADRPPRLVRYRIDPEAGTATYVSEVSDPRVVPYSHCCGSARRFGDGWLVAWGDSRVISGFDSADRLAFRLTLPASTYRAVPVPPEVSPAKIDAALEAFEPTPPIGVPVRPIKPFGRSAVSAKDAQGQ